MTRGSTAAGAFPHRSAPPVVCLQPQHCSKGGKWRGGWRRCHHRLQRAHAEQWELRLRGIYLAPANESDAYAPLAIPKNAIHVNDKWIPNIDIEYFFTAHLVERTGTHLSAKAVRNA